MIYDWCYFCPVLLTYEVLTIPVAIFEFLASLLVFLEPAVQNNLGLLAGADDDIIISGG